MSVLLVTDDADDDIPTDLITNEEEYIYKQLKELEHDFSSAAIVDSSPSILVESNQHYRQHRRRRRCRPQQCVVQHLLTYMLTLLILTNHLHWPVIILSLSSIRIMSTHASTITTTTTTAAVTTSVTSPNAKPPATTIIKRPVLTPSTTRSDEELCLPINGLQIDRICSRTCRARLSPFEKFDNFNPSRIDLGYLPFCSNILNQTLVREKFLSETTENECRETLEKIVESDEVARKATASFAFFMQSIDCASPENRYSIIQADCQKAYRTWACSVNIPYFYRNQLIPPCQTICDEVERVCPTFRPSDREPLFAGQPLFFCTGGIVTNSDYGRRPHCFDTCHLHHGSLQRPSSPLPFNETSSSLVPSINRFVEDLVTTPLCFDIQPLPPSSAEIALDESLSPNATNTSLSASARTISTSSGPSIMFTFIFFVLQRKFS